MGYVLYGIGGLLGLVATIMIIINAAPKAIWKAILSLICGIYALIYLFTEYDNPNKKTVIIMIVGAIVLSMIGAGMVGASAAGSVAPPVG